MKLPNGVYDVLKYLALIGLPAFGSFWMVVGGIWNIGHTDEVVKTIVAVATLLGALLVLNQVRWNNSDAKYDGVIDPVTANTQTSDTALNLKVDEYDAANQKDLVLKVKQQDPPIY